MLIKDVDEFPEFCVECTAELVWNLEDDPDGGYLGHYKAKCNCGLVYRATTSKFNIYVEREQEVTNGE